MIRVCNLGTGNVAKLLFDTFGIFEDINVLTGNWHEIYSSFPILKELRLHE